MQSSRLLRGLLLGYLLALLSGCGAARPPMLAGPQLQPGRYVQYVYRSPEFQPATVSYRVERLPVEFSRGVSSQQAEDLVQEALLVAMQNNGLRLAPTDAAANMTGRVERFVVSSPLWRFLSGRGAAHLQVRGEIRQQQEVVFAFADQVAINPPVNPRQQPPLEQELLARQAADRLAMNVLNELLLPPRLGADQSVSEAPPPQMQ